METIERFRNFINDVNTYYEGNLIDLFPYVDMLNNVLKILNDVEELKENYEKLYKTYIEEYESNRELDKRFETSVNDQLIKFIKVIEDKIEYLEKGVFLAPNDYIKGGIQALKELLKEVLEL